MSKLRFCLAGSYPADAAKIGGGVLCTMYLLGEVLAQRDDIDFHIVASTEGSDGVRVINRPGATVHQVGYKSRTLVPNIYTQPAKIAKVMSELNPDVINSHYAATTHAALMVGCKVAHTIHGIIDEEIQYQRGREKIAKMLESRLQHKSMMNADGVISVAQYGLDYYDRWIKSPARVISVPIEDIFWSTPDMKPCKGILFAGAIGKRKNLKALIEAMPVILNKHPDAALYVCGGTGDNAYKDEIDDFIESKNIGSSIKFLGVVDRRKLVELLGECVALSLPSYQETSPGVICQAMAAGRVAVASPVGGVPEMIEDGVTGFLVDADDSQLLANRIIELMDNFNSAAQMGAAAREVARTRYNARDVANSIIEFCTSLATPG